MPAILDPKGQVVSQSHNLRGIMRYLGREPVSEVSAAELPDRSGRLRIVFMNGNTYQTDFASFEVLCDWVRSRRNLKGAPIFFHGCPR